jgi:predicted HicB family RNase H-like nuclease
MTKRGRPPKGADYKPLTKVSFRFTPEVFAALKVGAGRKKVSQNAYVEGAIRLRLEADSVKLQ